MSKKEKTIIAIVDDHPLVLEGLKSLLQSNETYQLYSFTKGNAFIDFINSNPVDLVLLDIVLSDGSGLDFCKSIRKISPATIVIGVSNQAERSIIFQLLQNGASGYILKNADSQEITACIKDALDGKIALSKEVQEIMLSQPAPSIELPRITKREKQILQSIAEGHTSAEIAEKLFISLITVETHRRNLLQKFKAKNMIELVRMAMENRLI